MEGKRVEIVVGLMLLLVAAMEFGASSVRAHLPPGTCIKHCLSECKLSGVGFPACIRYCPVHCLPDDNLSTKQHYCNLGCMLDQCAKYTDNEEKMSSCVFDCRRKHHCKITD